MKNCVFNRKPESRLAKSRLLVVDVVDGLVEVRAYNFYKQWWDLGVCAMKTDHFLKNYEPMEIAA